MKKKYTQKEVDNIIKDMELEMSKSGNFEIMSVEDMILKFSKMNRKSFNISLGENTTVSLIDTKNKIKEFQNALDSIEYFIDTLQNIGINFNLDILEDGLSGYFDIRYNVDKVIINIPFNTFEKYESKIGNLDSLRNYLKALNKQIDKDIAKLHSTVYIPKNINLFQ